MTEMAVTTLGPVEARMLAFARSYADPTSTTYEDGVKSYQAVVPDASDETASRQARRYIVDPRVQAEIQKVQESARSLAALTPAAFVERCLEREKFFTNRGEKGDATAAAKMMELAGKAAGLFVNLTKDLTPPAARATATPEQLLEMAARVAAQIKQMNEPNPLPAVTVKAIGPVQDAEFEIMDDTSTEHA